MPVRVLELTTRIDHPPQWWLRLGQTRQLPQRDDESAMSCDARTEPRHRAGGLEGCQHPMQPRGTPSTEAAARAVDAALVGADPELGVGISKTISCTAV